MSVPATTRYLFFTGKGGVGKTSVAAATAVALADGGARVLLVSTDPASNLDAVLDTPLASTPRAVVAAPGLDALNIDPEAAASAYRERAIGPWRDRLPASAVASMEEQLAGACTVEVAAFDEFAGLLADPQCTRDYAHVVFDTAPTGHTLRLLRLPAAWSGFLAESTRGVSCLGPSSALDSSRETYAAAAATLADAARATLLLVTRPEATALAEAARTSAELRELGLDNQRLVVNGVFRSHAPGDPMASAFEHRATEALADLPPALQSLPRDEIMLRGHDILGIPALRELLAQAPADTDPAPGAEPGVTATGGSPAGLGALVDDLESAGHGLVMVMGKGGVGKTTLASALAVALAARGHPVHLSTTDPAAHLRDALADEVDELSVSRIDPEAANRAYVEHVLATAGRDLDADGREMLAEELRSPCTEEIAVFHAFSAVIREARRKFVVLDTAPTGHTLLLLDATGSYHRQILRDMDGRSAAAATTPLMRLRDPDHTRVLIATLAETTPVQEAAQLQQDLRRAGIEPHAWVVNQALDPNATRDPVLRSRAAAQQRQLDHVRADLAPRCLVVPWRAAPPATAEQLLELVGPRGTAHTTTDRRSAAGRGSAGAFG